MNLPGRGPYAESSPGADAPEVMIGSVLPILDTMKLSRPLSWFLLAFGAWSWCVWITFVKNLVKDGSGLAFDAGHPTAYFWIHLTLAVVSFLLGTVIGVVGFRGLRALRRETPAASAEGAGETREVTHTTV